MRLRAPVGKLVLMGSPKEVLEYWFGNGDGDNRSLWFGGGPEIDEEIRQRFGAMVEDAVWGRLDHWSRVPRERLALIILLDQMSRNVHRGTRAAFIGDRAAQRHTVKAVAKGEDRLLSPYERAFLYMPLMHAEDPALQEKAVALFERLFAEAPAAEREAFRSFVTHARDHAAIVHRFGRFPDRNALLGRESTQAELRFLRDERRPWFERQPE